MDLDKEAILNNFKKSLKEMGYTDFQITDDNTVGCFTVFISDPKDPEKFLELANKYNFKGKAKRYDNKTDIYVFKAYHGDTTLK
jgi:hypothetical protein